MTKRSVPGGLGVVGAAVVAGVLMTGCENLPGNEETQGAVIGGASGAVLGAVIADDPLLGGLIGGALGAGAGYLIGANWEHITGDDEDEATEAVREAQTNPATAEEARAAPTADVNGDGFVTLDEVVAQERAGFTDDEIITRLEATGQVFSLNEDQRQYLRDNGVSVRVAESLENINREQRNQLIEMRRQQLQKQGGDVSGRDSSR